MSSSPFVRYLFAFISGILLAEFGFFTPWVIYSISISGISIFLVSFLTSSKSRGNLPAIFKGASVLLVLICLGWLTTYFHTDSRYANHLLHQTDTLLAYEGVVDAQPEERAKTYRVELEIQRGKTNHGWRQIKGRVIVYLDKSGLPLPQYGERWLVNGAPRLIDPPLNPGEFNYQRYLRYRNIFHQQYLRQYQRIILGTSPPYWLTKTAIGLNQWADSVFTHHISSRREFAIVNAMLLGVRDDLDPDLYRSYAAAGAIHVLSVSGLHVGILFMVLTWVLGFLKRTPKGRWVMLVIQLSVLWFYALITGFSPAVLRSAGMFTMLILAQGVGRPQQLTNTLCASAFFILLLSPFSLFSAGFQLSYLAVAAIGGWHPSLFQSITLPNRWLTKLWELTSVALVAQLVTFPLGVYYFHQFPAYFLLANPVVLILSNVMLPLAMATVFFSWIPGLNQLLGWFLHKTALLLNYCVDLTGKLPGAIQEGFWLSPTELVFLYAIILCGVGLLLSRQLIYSWALAGLSFSLATLLSIDYYQQAHQKKLAVHFLPHRTAISITEGHKATLLTDLNVKADPRSFEFYLKNTFSQWGVSDLTVASTDSNAVGQAGFHSTQHYALWVWRGKSILIVNRLTDRAQWRLLAVIDYLIIRKNALQHWSQLNGRVVARHIIFDDSNRTPLTDRLLAEAKAEHIACYSVRQQGAYIQDL